LSVFFSTDEQEKTNKNNGLVQPLGTISRFAGYLTLI